MSLRLGGDGAITGCSSLSEPALTLSGLTVSGQIFTVSGTAAAPGITFVDDSDTGIYSPAANQVAITTSGAHQVRVTADGNVGIGTTAPNAKLEIVSTSDTNVRIRSGDSNAASLYFGSAADAEEAAIRYYNSNNSLRFFGHDMSEAMRIDSNGSLGIGTASPDARFEVVNSSASLVEVSRFRTEGNTNNPMLRILVDESEPKACIRSSGSVASKLTFGAGNRDDITISTIGNVGINNSSPVSPLDIITANGRMLVREDQNDICLDSVNTANSAFDILRIRGYNLLFQYGGTERMRIAGPSGNVGIGTSSPESLLEIYKNTANDNTDIRVKTFRPGIRFIDQSSSSEDGEIVQDGGSMRFRISAEVNASTALTERMRILDTGTLTLSDNATTDPIGNNKAFALAAGSGASGGAINYYGTGADVLKLGRGSNGRICRFFRNQPNATEVGSISVTTTATAYNTSSDYRLKENVVDIADGITRVKQLAPKRFNFIADADTTFDGFLAHEAQTVVPEAVTGSKDEVDDDGNPMMQGIDHSKLVPLLTAALKEAITKIEALESQVASLQASA